MRGYRGFSLIEILVSIALVGLIALIAALLISTIGVSRSARQTAMATQIAESAIEAARAAGSTSSTPGPLTDPRLDELLEGSGTISMAPYEETLSEVTVRVSWQDPSSSEEKSVTLTTLIADTGI